MPRSCSIRHLSLVAATALMASLSPSIAHAEWRHGGYGGYGGYGGPRYYGGGYYHRGPGVGAIIGGALLGLGVGAAILSAPSFYAPPPVVYAPPPPYYPSPGYGYAPGYAPPPAYYPPPGYYGR